MSHLTIRMNAEDESNLMILQKAWGVGRSEIGRRALDLAVAYVKQEPRKSKRELLDESGLLGVLDTKGELRKNYKNMIEEKITKKNVTKKHHR